MQGLETHGKHAQNLSQYLANHSQCLFILDASHRVEEQLLRTLIDQYCQSKPALSATICVVKISKKPEAIDAKHLVEAIATLADDTLCIPARLAWQLNSDTKQEVRLRSLLFSNQYRPNRRRAKQLLKQQPEAAQCIFGEPATLADLNQRLSLRLVQLPGHISLAQFVANQAALALEVAERRLRGRRYKVPHHVAQQLASHPRFQKALLSVSEETGKSPEQLLKAAKPMFKELIAVPQKFWQDVAGALSHRILKLGYEAKPVVDPAKLHAFRQMVSENPSALLWTHKTHMDGIAVWSTLFDHDFPAPHMVGGINMAFAGMGYLARHGGCIFIRRSFKHDPLYKTVLRQYIGYLLEKRFPLTWAFEGTRSRLGKLMPPRYGILKYVLEGAVSCDAKNLHIIPIAISYDLIGDVKDYNREQSGARKRPESLAWFVNYLRGLRQPLGRIYINFGEPVICEQAPNLADPLTLEKIAFQVGVETNRVTPITLTSLISFALLGAAPRALTMKELRAQIAKLVQWAKAHQIELTDDFDADHRDHMLHLLSVVLNTGMVTRFDEGPEAVFAIKAEQHPVASYYRNTIVHHFVNKAIAELALLQVVRFCRTREADDGDSHNALAVFWDEAERLRELFKFEFFYTPKEHFKDDIDREISFFRADWQQQIQQKPIRALSTLQGMQPLVAHSTLLQFTEAYRLICDIAARHDDTQSLDEKACIAATFRYAKQAYLQRRISSHASIAKLLFQNGFALLDNLQLVEAKAGVQRQRQALSREFRALSHRIERIRSISLPGQMDLF